MGPPFPESLLQAVRGGARPFGTTIPAELLDQLAARRISLLGEASHGTQEFHELRVAITKVLVTHHGCRAVVIEGDWADAWRVNRWVRALDGGSADDALAGFQRFPTWMWRNTVVRDFIAWLREHNAGRPPGEQTGVYGMDQYSLLASAQAVLAYLERADPDAAQRARRRYGCFDHFQQDLQAYGYAAGFGTGFSCEDAVVAQLTELLRKAGAAPQQDPDGLFHAQQNARLVGNADQYYRGMFRGRASSWNLRALHLADTLQALSAHLQDGAGAPPRMAVWAHNSHSGDASATGMADHGEWSVGQLLRKRCDGDVFLLGFTTHAGAVRAATHWDGPGEVKTVLPGLAGGWEALLHEAGHERLLLLPDQALRRQLDVPLLERAIGVVYRPQTERLSHYFSARLGAQFDAVLHVDRTRAVDELPPSTAGAPVPEVRATDPVGV